ncbi:MAG: flotillin family protein [Acidobacteriota bacterium]
MENLLPVIGVIVTGFILLMGVAVIITKFYRKVDQGQALINNKMNTVSVDFRGGVVIPIIHRAEIMEISVKTIEIDRRGNDGLICQDNIRADIKVTFFVRVNKTREDVLKVAQLIGCHRASDQQTLEELFSAKFSEALKTVGKKLDFVDLYTRRDDFRDQIIQVIGTDLNGYVLDDCAIDYLEQTPVASLDEKNILDAQGIKKITELTVREKIETNSFENDERKRIQQQNVEADEAIFELERQRAEAEAKKFREIETVQARETAETLKVQAEEKLRHETANIKTQQELAVQEENKQREIQVAGKNRERVVLVETERVEKDRALEAVSREREVELSRIEKEKALEIERKEIQDVIRERVSVERTVAEEEERIKEVRVVEEAKRTKTSLVIAAEAEAEEKLVRDIKAAEAAEKAAAHRAKEQVVLADANLEASEKDASAKIRLAEGVQAETAAEGLAHIRVKEADASATQALGTAEANVVREKGNAEADALARQLDAEATGLGQKMQAEAAGLTEKAKAMAALDEASRDHEEYRIRLEKDKAVEIAGIEANREIAEAQARVLAEALKEANIDIVGGESMFVDRLVGAMGQGKAIDGFVNKSATAQAAVGPYLEGERSFAGDVKDVLSNPRLGSADLSNLSVAAVLGQLIMGAKGERKGKLEQLRAAADELGISDLKLGD